LDTFFVRFKIDRRFIPTVQGSSRIQAHTEQRWKFHQLLKRQRKQIVVVMSSKVLVIDCFQFQWGAPNRLSSSQVSIALAARITRNTLCVYGGSTEIVGRSGSLFSR
jgi:hypothetical protein